MTCEILLEFYGDNPQLSKVHFRKDNGEVIAAVRGKTSGACHSAGSFQWSSAVRALSSLFARTHLAGIDSNSASLATLSGFGGSLASTLDYALSKQPSWTTDMFGVDACGHSYLRRLLLRTNPERKYPGPVVITTNSRVLSSSKIIIWWNGVKINSSDKIRELINLLEIPAKISKNGGRNELVERIAA